MPPSARDEFCADLRAAQKACGSALVDKRAQAADRHWKLWLEFCSSHALDPWFTQGDDPIPYLQVFAHRLRTRRVGPGGHAIRSGTVADILRSIAQAYRGVGANDPRLDGSGQTDFRLDRQLKAYTKADPPAQRVKPIPIQVIVFLLRAAYFGATGLAPLTDLQAIADMACIGFYWMMRPGEHTLTPTNTPFKVRDVKIYANGKNLTYPNLTTQELDAANSISLTFTTQKNGVKGEVISHGLSGHGLACPVHSIGRRLLYHQSHQSHEDTPLCAYYTTNKTRFVRSQDLTRAVRAAITQMVAHGEVLDILPHEVSGRSLRAGGATSLMCAGVDPTIVQLQGRWKSDTMIRYLHISAHPDVHKFATQMFAGGHYTFRPGYTLISPDGATD